VAADTETAVLAGGCFRGMQELLRDRDGVMSTRVGYTGGENENPTDNNHPGHAEAVEVVFDPGGPPTGTSWSSSSRSTTRRPGTAKARTPARSTGPRSSARTESSARSRRPRSPTSTPPACGLARSSPRSARPTRSGRPRPKARTTSSATPTAPPAISRGRAGSCRAAIRRKAATALGGSASHSGPATS
jgi:peptide methionine sulfoxide reductase